MADNQTKQKNNKLAKGLGIAALVAAATAAAGAIFFYGTETGKRKRKQIKSWMIKMRADVVDKMSSMKDWSEEAYHSVVDAVAERYSKIKNVDLAELAALVSDLKSHWRTIKSQTESGRKKKTTRKPKKTE